MFVTANVILSKLLDNGRVNYSVWYGQDYTPSDSDALTEDSFRGEVVEIGPSGVSYAASKPDPKGGRQELSQICERFSCATVTEFQRKFPKSFDVGVVADRFAAVIGDTSGVAIHSVINYVVVLSTLVKKSAVSSALKPGVPRVETLK